VRDNQKKKQRKQHTREREKQTHVTTHTTPSIFIKTDFVKNIYFQRQIILQKSYLHPDSFVRN
jgi:hypothetical protein